TARTQTSSSSRRTTATTRSAARSCSTRMPSSSCAPSGTTSRWAPAGGGNDDLRPAHVLGPPAGTTRPGHPHHIQRAPTPASRAHPRPLLRRHYAPPSGGGQPPILGDAHTRPTRRPHGARGVPPRPI